MPIDLVALVRRVVLATSPLLGGACNYCPSPLPPNEPFDVQMMVFEDDSFVLIDSGKPVPDPPDAGTNGGLRGKILPLDFRMAYDACAADHKKCGDMCELIAKVMWFVNHKVQTCQVVGGPPDRPILQVAGLGTNGACGRRPEDLEIVSAPGTTGGYLAECAALEAASVHAFRILASELDTCGAPAPLAAAARSAARDEIRHARLMRALARRHGGGPCTLRVPRARPRPLTTIARENAVEGCVRETFGAVMAHVQARTAADPAVRVVMGGIAADETRHAQLGWAVHEWASGQMSRSERRTLAGAQEAAVEALRAEYAAGHPSPALGIPPAAMATALIDELSRTLWRARRARKHWR
jgi:hypothetical protein